MGSVKNITIEIYRRKSGGFSWRFVHANGKVANDIYVQKRGARTTLNSFLTKIQKGEFKVVYKN